MAQGNDGHQCVDVVAQLHAGQLAADEHAGDRADQAAVEHQAQLGLGEDAEVGDHGEDLLNAIADEHVQRASADDRAAKRTGQDQQTVFEGELLLVRAVQAHQHGGDDRTGHHQAVTGYLTAKKGDISQHEEPPVDSKVRAFLRMKERAELTLPAC